jgi:hypothetical protein
MNGEGKPTAPAPPVFSPTTPANANPWTFFRAAGAAIIRPPPSSRQDVQENGFEFGLWICPWIDQRSAMGWDWVGIGPLALSGT